MLDCWESLFHIDGYLPIRKLSVTDVLLIGKVRMNSAFNWKLGKGSLIRGANAQVPPAIILLKGSRFAVWRQGDNGSNCSKSHRSFQFLIEENPVNT